MVSIKYKIDFYTFWHIGSGLSGGTYADNLVLKDSNGLPFIPGKTLKGLFKETSKEICRLDPDLVEEGAISSVFGLEVGNNPISESNPLPSKSRFRDDYKLSSTFFKDAVLSSTLAIKLLNAEGQDNNTEGRKAASLYEVISSTKITGNGIAEDGSLRELEVCVPLTLYGTIELFEEIDISFLKYSAAMIKSIGLNRNRGLGRCKVTLLKDVL